MSSLCRTIVREMDRNERSRKLYKNQNYNRRTRRSKDYKKKIKEINNDR